MDKRGDIGPHTPPADGKPDNRVASTGDKHEKSASASTDLLGLVADRVANELVAKAANKQ